MALLDPAQIDLQLASLPGWRRDADTIQRTFDCPSFPGAISFVTHVGFVAERMNHHPDIDIRWRHVDITLSTHDEGGITQSDIELATQISEIFEHKQ